MKISNEIIKEIEEYLDQISGGKYLGSKFAHEEKSDEMFLGRIKKSLTKRSQNLNRDMNIDEMKTILLKLQIWRDRIRILLHGGKSLSPKCKEKNKKNQFCYNF